MIKFKCPRCGAVMRRVNLGFDTAGESYECPVCEYQDCLPKTAGFGANAYGCPCDPPIPHVHGGTIVGVSYEADETIVRVKLDNADERIRKAHVLIIDTGKGE